ncbi:aspartyl/glutamyl-tRNA amidotransferase subunit B [Leifsonia xyli subsp. cynodontis DSM 46306]|uniref:Anhydro-N-acetylmuramic acid kinase n=1 Tax=Leifsonia xyli subsp. cynodontis DSM 46306 TaxID=1389489 RepID=U3PCM9_LEIXC|nr:anhydro-N-acetylmuramic acid kinase [Leifsonia xyli]AGW42517.1 aspartyl/glutamyl-tRNA amidotransferase subunit B [Leifsonia xyli subsp. cynodontis DSM 46306]
MQSGTSVDGIDVAVADIVPLDDGDRPALSLRTLLARTVPWSSPAHADLLAAVAGAALTPEAFCRLDTVAGQEFASAAALAAEEAGGVELAVSYGQTLHHWVEDGHARGTLQIGQPAWIAERLGVPVLSNVRAADIAAGGEGAPLMGLFDRAWLAGEAVRAGRPVATVNLGGIANVQVVSSDGGLVAFDSGPANALIDAVVARATGDAQTQDTDGLLAAAGAADEALLSELLAHPYFAAPPPKSTGRETFDLAVVDRALAIAGSEPGLADLVATLTALTARTVADAVRFAVPQPPARVVVSGRGVRNPALLRALGTALGLHGIPVVTSDELGIDADHKESLLFALVGYLSWHGIPVGLPGTPIDRARVLGQLTLTPGTVPGRPLAGIAGLELAERSTPATP